MARVPTSMSPAKPEGSKKPGKPVKTPKKEKVKTIAAAASQKGAGPGWQPNIGSGKKK